MTATERIRMPWRQNLITPFSKNFDKTIDNDETSKLINEYYFCRTKQKWERNIWR